MMVMLWMGVLLLLLGWGLGGEGSCVFRRDGYSLQWDYSSEEIFFSLTADVRESTGYWTGVGFGNNMRSGDFILAEYRENGGVSITDRVANGYAAPSIDGTQNVDIVSDPIVENGVLSVEFSRLRDTGDREDNSLMGCQTFQFVVKGGRISSGGNLEIHKQDPIRVEVCPEQCSANAPTGGPVEIGAEGSPGVNEGSHESGGYPYGGGSHSRGSSSEEGSHSHSHEEGMDSSEEGTDTDEGFGGVGGPPGTQTRGRATAEVRRRGMAGFNQGFNQVNHDRIRQFLLNWYRNQRNRN